MEWISVEDRLPESFDECLVYPVPNQDMNILSACYNPSKKVWEQDFYNGYEYEDFNPVVTHWMPLPEPPSK